MPAVLKHSMVILLVSLAAIFLSYFYLDKNIVYLAYEYKLRQYVFLQYLSQFPLIFIPLPLLFYPYLAIRRAYVSGQLFLPLEKFLLAFSNSIAISFFLKEILKLICSRYWPMAWKGNLSLLKHGVYGFNWFQFSTVNNAFPSGHAAITFAGLTVIAVYFHKIRWLIWLAGISVLLSLVAEYFHFLSDVIAGACLGYLVGYFNINWVVREKV